MKIEQYFDGRKEQQFRFEIDGKTVRTVGSLIDVDYKMPCSYFTRGSDGNVYRVNYKSRADMVTELPVPIEKAEEFKI